MIKINAPAKLNLFLHITGRRKDGYHNLDSLFTFTEFGDELTFTSSESVTVTMSGPFAQALTNTAVENNLIYRAAKLLQERFNITLGVDIICQKNIPVCAGIGGGSADAAATLIGLNSLWNLQLSVNQLAKMAIDLGADVPACLYQAPLFIQGIGDLITPIDFSAKAPWVLLVNPLQNLSTPHIFQLFHHQQQGYTPPLSNTLEYDNQDWNRLLLQTHNDLETAAMTSLPILKDILNELKTQTGVYFARMSGSGATCFALFANKEEAKTALQQMHLIFDNLWGIVTKIKGAN